MPEYCTNRQILPLMKRGWFLLLREWRAMLLYTILVWSAGAFMLLPLAATLLNKLASFGDVIVGNYTIVLWMLTPKGLAYLLLGGSVVFFSIILNVAGLLMIARDARRSLISVALVFRDLALEAHNLLHLSLSVFCALMPFAAAIPAVPFLLKVLLLPRHDINYYLTAHPPVWYLVLGLSAIWIAGCTLVLLYLIVRLLYLIPLWLDGVHPAKAAATASWQGTAGKGGFLGKLLGGAIIILLGLLLVPDLLLFGITRQLLLDFHHTPEGVVWLVSAYLVIAGLLKAAALFLWCAWLTCLVELSYEHEFKPKQTAQIETDADRLRLNLSPASVIAFLKIAFAVIVILFAVTAVIGARVMTQKVPLTPPLIIAHRAGAAQSPENSLSGLRRVLKDGYADLAEIDVSITRDGYLVVAHDKDLMKQAGNPSIIRETDFNELRTIDIGHSFDSQFTGEHLGRLDDFLDMARGKIPLIVEFKHGEGTNLVERVVAEVKRHRMDQNVIIMSLELSDIRQVQKVAPEIRTGYFASVEIGDLTKLDVYCIGAKNWMVDGDFISAVHAKGMKVYVWTVDDPYRMVELAYLGVDGIITNNPVMAFKVLEKFRSLTPPIRILLRFHRFWSVFHQMGWW